MLSKCVTISIEIIYKVCKTSIGGPYDSNQYGLSKDLFTILCI